MDAHKASITGVSFSVSEGTAVYVPFCHRTGQNGEYQPEIWKFLKTNVFMSPNTIKIAHNLSFESMFLYALNIVVQLPCYDTIAASQLTLKNKMRYRSLSDSGLKTLVPELFGVTMPSFGTVTAGRHFDQMDPQNEETIRYACADSDYALRLYHLFNASVMNQYFNHIRLICSLS